MTMLSVSMQPPLRRLTPFRSEPSVTPVAAKMQSPRAISAAGHPDDVDVGILGIFVDALRAALVGAREGEVMLFDLRVNGDIESRLAQKIDADPELHLRHSR